MHATKQERMSSTVNNELEADDTELLRTCIDGGNKEGLVNFLTQGGASVNTRLNLHHKDEKTFPLHLAVNVPCDKCNFNIVKYLISEGADCNTRDNKGYSPLHYSVLRKNIATTKALLDAGANVNLQVKPLEPSFEGVNCGYNKGSIIWRKRKSFPLHLAVSTHSGFPTLITRSRELIDIYSHGVMIRADQNSQNKQENYDQIKLLLSHGADCNLRDSSELAPLHYAVSQNDECLVGMLLEAGANINMLAGEKPATPLFHVSQVSMLKYLLSRKADPEIVGWDSSSLLYYFITRGQRDLTKYLISDADLCLETRNHHHQSPLAAALKIQYDDIINFLLCAGCDPSPEVLKVNDRNSWIYTTEGEELVNKMTDIACNARPLVDLCTFRIRRILKRNITRAVQALPLPAKLKGRITLAHVS